MAGLMALLTILAAAPARAVGNPPPLELAATAAALERAGAGVWVPSADAIKRLLDLTKQGGAGWGGHVFERCLRVCFKRRPSMR
jgi:hypothetical protein